MKRRKKIVGLLLAAIMIMGSSMSVFAATSTASWDISTYPSVSDSGSRVLYDANAGATCFVGCTFYNSSNNSSIKFSSTNFYSSVSIGGVGTVYAQKRVAKPTNTYTVSYSCNNTGRTIANGKLIG